MTEYRIRVTSPDGPLWALVDAEDFDRFGSRPWYVSDGYATRSQARRTIYMHREILGLQPGDKLVCDHINWNKLDNRRANLRAVTHAINMRNLPRIAGSTSHYLGVSLERARRRWVAQARDAGGVKYHLGRFEEEYDAARAVDTFWRSQGWDAPNGTDLAEAA